MPKLTEDVQRFIVESLACYDTPSQVVEGVSEQFGISMVRQHVEKYDPTKHAGRTLSKRWRAVFESARANFKAGVAEVPIANRVYRLRILNQLTTKNLRNAALAAQLLEQAAKEVGDVYVNRGRAGAGDGAGDEPVPTKVERGVKDARRHDGSS